MDDYLTQNELTVELSRKLVAGLSGDGKAYAAFLTQVSPLLRRVIGRKIPMGDVEDVLQEVLMSIHKARHTYDGDRPLIPWLMAITHFRITDCLRKVYSQMRHKQVDIADFENELEAVTEELSQNESIDEILENVAQREKEILTLMYVEGFTAHEVGLKLGMKATTVKVAAHRAIKKIKEGLSND
jgi:RNA polymerase sigma-70 factor, ECF subfamily